MAAAAAKRESSGKSKSSKKQKSLDVELSLPDVAELAGGLK